MSTMCSWRVSMSRTMHKGHRSRYWQVLRGTLSYARPVVSRSGHAPWSDWSLLLKEQSLTPGLPSGVWALPREASLARVP